MIIGPDGPSPRWDRRVRSPSLEEHGLLAEGDGLRCCRCYRSTLKTNCLRSGSDSVPLGTNHAYCRHRRRQP
jgi:hypothetical protein